MITDKTVEFVCQFNEHQAQFKHVLRAYVKACMMQNWPEADRLVLECTATLEMLLDSERALLKAIMGV